MCLAVAAADGRADLHLAEEGARLHAERVGGDGPDQGDEAELPHGEGHERGGDVEQPRRHQRGHPEGPAARSPREGRRRGAQRRRKRRTHRRKKKEEFCSDTFCRSQLTRPGNRRIITSRAVE